MLFLSRSRALLLCTVLSCSLPACGGEGSTNTSVGPNHVSGTTRIDILPTGYASVSAPRFNQAGTQLAMLGQTSEGTEHVLVTDREGELVRVVARQGVGYLTTFAWSADDKTLYFSGDEGIVSVDASVDEPTANVVVDAFAVSGFDVSRDGTRVAWSTNGQQSVSLGALSAGALDRSVEVKRVTGGAPRFSPDGSTLLFVTSETFATLSTSTFDEDFQVLLPGEASYLSNGAWFDEHTVVLLADDAIIRRELDPPLGTTLEEQFAATGLDVDATGDYVFHVNGGVSLTLVDLP